MTTMTKQFFVIQHGDETVRALHRGSLRACESFICAKGSKGDYEVRPVVPTVELLPREEKLLPLLKGIGIDAQTITRRSEREFDLDIDGLRGEDMHLFSAWLPLLIVRELVEWCDGRVALLTDYPSMVAEGDWSGVRDSDPKRVWEIVTSAFDGRLPLQDEPRRLAIVAAMRNQPLAFAEPSPDLIAKDEGEFHFLIPMNSVAQAWVDKLDVRAACRYAFIGRPGSKVAIASSSVRRYTKLAQQAGLTLEQG